LSAGVYRPERERRGELRARIGGGPALLLDGATGTELERRGVRTPLPAWSAPALLEHPDVILAIHADYVHAGVEALTANTFRTQRRALAAAGLSDRAAELTARAVALARRAGSSGPIPPFVLGSAPPLEDCYRPDRVPGAEALAREHAEHVSHLDAAGVDGVLVETMNTRREAEVAARAAVARGLPTLVSFVCWDGARLLSGESLRDAADDARRVGASAVLVNCLPPSNVSACLPVLAEVGLPFGVYANLGEPNDDTGFTRSEECGPGGFAAHGSDWIRAGAHIVGGCCGTTPEHLRALGRMLRGG
jgi:S-methylmethionine-dependent homocysteine/selenocysteine methylase